MKEWMSRREPLIGSTLWNIIKLLFRAKFRIHPRYWYRLFMTININLFLFPLRLIEKIKFSRKIKKHEISVEPIFIIGHWRTGTTYLHYLLSNDETKGYPRNVDVYTPHCSLVAPDYMKRLVEVAMPERRPMDDVELTASKPGEEEFAMALKSKFSYYHVFIFPRRMDYFSQFLTFNKSSKRSIRGWKKHYVNYIKKISFINGEKQLILKNPPNTGRIKLLKDIFPKAKFVYLHRNPYEIYASSILLFQRLLPYFSLQKWDEKKIKTKILMNFVEMIEEYERSKKTLTEDEIIEVKYEDLIADPLSELGKIYHKLDLKGFEESVESIQEFIKTQHQYKANKHIISKEIINDVNNNWEKYREKYGYSKREG